MKLSLPFPNGCYTAAIRDPKVAIPLKLRNMKTRETRLLPGTLARPLTWVEGRLLIE